MNFEKNKAMTTAIALILLMASSMLAAISVKAQDYTNMQEGGSIPLPAGVTPDLSLDTTAYMSFRPNPVGVGQAVLVNIWLQGPPHPSRYFSDYKVTITDPEGNEEIYTRDSYRADATAWLEFVPDQTGEWKLKFDFPGGYFPSGNYTIAAGGSFPPGVYSFPESVYYKPSSTPVQTLVVQEEPVPSWPASPLPTDYWTRPVSPDNREWWSISGWFPSTGVVGGGSDWPADTNPYMSNYGWLPTFIPYVQAPNTAHIVWKREGEIGGLIGGPLGEQSLTTGGGNPTIVYAGRCYQTLTKVLNGVPTSVWQCYDLRTGEVYWEIPGVPAPTWVAYEFGVGEVPGAVTQTKSVYLIGISAGRLIKYDPYTGAVFQNVSIAPLMQGFFYANLDSPYFLSVQDLGTAVPSTERYRLINWTVTTRDVGIRVANNITWPFSSIGLATGGADFNAGIAASGYAITTPATGPGVPNDIGLQAADIYTGQLLFNKTLGIPYGSFGMLMVTDHGKNAMACYDGYIYCFDARTGEKLWKSELSSSPWGVFRDYRLQSYGGMIFSYQYDGVAAFNWTNGKLVWLYEQITPYPYETPYQGKYAFFGGGLGLFADGKLYTSTYEHTPTQPVTRGWKFHCINITTGEGIWSIAGAMAAGAVADGYVTASNSYDGYMYVFGKGKSATTVTAPDTAVTLGDSVVIRGTVTDQSPGQPGTACVSDESMSAWMEYLHMQKPMPSNATGVEVQLDVLDSNNNYYTIGTVTTDLSGSFGFAYEPEIPGFFKVIATFAGSESYGSSYAITYFNVEEAPAATPAPTPTPAPMTDTYITGFGIAIIVAIAIVGILLFRKRP
jgi:outer membrane protein assembly factor BamB